MELVARCPVCDGDRLVPYAMSPRAPERLHSEQARCAGCGLLVSQPQASAEELARYYGSRFYEDQWPDAERLFEENRRDMARRELPVLRALWADAPPPPGAETLEVGCGYGALLAALADEGLRVRGCEPSARAAAFARGRGFDVVEGGAPGLPYPAESFDLVVCNHVIEHLRDPLGFVRELLALVRPGGRIVIGTEDAEPSQYRATRLLCHLRGQVPPFRSSSDHTFVFGARQLGRLLERAGTVEIRTRTFAQVAERESLHWRAYLGVFRAIDRLSGHGDLLIATGRRPVR